MRIQTLPKPQFGTSQPLNKRLENYLAKNGLGERSVQVGYTPEKALLVTVNTAEDEAAVNVLLKDPQTLIASFEGSPVEIVRMYGLPTNG